MWGNRGTTQVPQQQPHWPTPPGNALYALSCPCAPSVICLSLLTHCVRAAASRTFCTAGTSRAIRMAMMAITTNNSINVKASLRRMEANLLGWEANKDRLERNDTCPIDKMLWGEAARGQRL